MAGVKALAGNGPVRVLFPDFHDIPEFSDCASRSPEHMDRTIHVARSLLVGLVHLKVDFGRRSVVLAASVNCFGDAKAAEVLLHGGVRECCG
jgi:hypothetical protein